MPNTISSRVSNHTLKKIRKSKKSRSKTRCNKAHISKSLKSTTPQQYYYSQSSSYVKKFSNGIVEEHGVEVVDSSNSDKILVRKLNNGKVVESAIAK